MAFIETPEGSYVCAHVIDELGFVSLRLGGSEYVVHLNEDGGLGRDVRFTVASDPFLFTVRN